MNQEEQKTEINNNTFQEISDYLKLDSRRYDNTIKEDE